MSTTSINIKQQIIAKSHSGVSQQKIAADLKISRTAVYNAFKKWKNVGALTDKNRFWKKTHINSKR